MSTLKKKCLVLLMGIMFIMTACSQAEPAPTPTLTPIPPTPGTPPERLETFDYDPLLPLEIEWGKVSEKDGVAVQLISYASLMGDRVPAYFVKPVGEGPYPAVIFLHCGHTAACTKAEFSYETRQLALRGIASISIDGPLLRMSDANFDPESMFIYSVLDIRRAVDLLGSQPEIDGGRIGFVGHSYGATTGGILAGVDTRVKALVLMAGHAQISELNGPKTIQYLNAENFIPYASHADLFFQFAEEDLFISREDAEYYFEVASQPKEIRWYAASHDFNTQAMNDRLDWLEAVLE